MKNLNFELEADLQELVKYPYNENFNKYYVGDTPGLNFNHKLRDFEEFTVAAQRFRDYGKYTNHVFSTHPFSKYFKHWKEEKRRCLEGYNIGRDWIPGYMYYYLNYHRVEKVVVKDEDLPKLWKGQKVKVKRINDFPDPWDYDYYFYHYVDEAEEAGEHGSVLKSRGMGYSYKGGGMINRNYFLIPNSLSYVIADEKGYLDGTDGLLNRAFKAREFVNKHTGFYKHSQVRNTAINYRASYIKYDSHKRPLEQGSMAEVLGIALKGNVGRARGKRGKLILWEEAGNFNKLTEAWQIARESVEQNGAVYGFMLAFGTSGSDPKYFNNLKEMFLKPRAYGIHAIPDIWSKKQKKDKVCMFIPSYANSTGLMDKDGNSYISEAYAIEEFKVQQLIEDKAESAVILQKRMERPKHPEEALMRKGKNIFPTNMLRDVLSIVDEEQETNDFRYIGRMGVDAGGKVVFLESNTVKEVAEFPHNNDEDNTGAVVVYKKPIIRNGKVLADVYIAGSDPYDHDKSTTSSLGSTLIMNSVTGEIVAEYTGRPDRAETYWEQVRLLLLYYNARINFENDLVGFRNHVENKNCGYLLVDTPEVILSLTPNTKVDRTKGTHATYKNNRYARSIIVNYLKENISDGDERTMAYTIKSKPLLQELIDWNIDGNYDRVSAFGMLMILYADTVRGGSKAYEEDEYTHANDDAWNELLSV